jgi:4-cresol dehydrogenase (hydroxylating) flavoprotein subunit
MPQAQIVSIDSAALSAALHEWREVLGADAIAADPTAADRASTATFATSARVAAVLAPADRMQVQHCMRIANRFEIPVYPTSTGKNWGYGSKAPVQDAVLLDLGRLNRITDFSEELAYVTIEAGVTQRQLHAFLRAQGSRLWMDATGSSPDCSIIGNTIERGFGHTPYGDHCSHACGFEVVLPTGNCMETGFCRFPQSKTGPLNRWGVGPSLDGLFSQSNLGIVTRMSIWLMPAPEYFQAFFFQSQEEIGTLVEAVRPLRLNGTLRSIIHLGNDYKILSGTGEYPWNATGGRTPVAPETMASLRRDLQMGRWSGSGGLYGTRSQVREARTSLRRALHGKVDRLQFVDERMLALIRTIERPYHFLTRRTDLRRALKIVPPLLDVLKGIPTEGFLPSAYWRKRRGASDDFDPDRDRCGLLWCSPVAPNTGEHAETVTQLGTAIALEHGFEPIISMSLINERSTITTIAITYDRQIDGEDEKAMRCYRALTQALLAQGYPPYRLNVASMEYGHTGGDYAAALQAIKAALDPKGILAPGRYEPAAG